MSMSQKRSTELQSNNKRPIDKEVYLDAQSKGFASRIVKYHQETSSSRQKSQYKSPGDLPIVHLKRNDILFKNRRSNSLSNLRVGRLDKCYSGGNAEGEAGTRRLPALQRGLTSYDDTYRPIPVRPTAAASSSTCDAFSGPRSVLDELKEISRKRINNKYDEEVHLNEKKKYCRDTAEVTDGPSGVPVVLMSANHFHHHQQQQQQKRQRDNNISPTLSPGVAQQRPKKLCRDSYDVISSLSSSIGLARSKSTIPSAPLLPSVVKRPAGASGAELRPSKTGLAPHVINALPQAMAVAGNRPQDTTTTLRATASVPALALTKAAVQEEPKLTLFNKDYKTIVARKQRVANSDDEYEDDDTAGRNPFVKPQDNSPTLATGFEEKRKAEKNKLALMLKCLAGDFEDSDEEEHPKDVVDTPIKAATNTMPNIPATTVTPLIASTPVTEPIKFAEKVTNQVVVETTKSTPEPQPLLAQPTAEDNVVKPTNIAPSIPAIVNLDKEPEKIVSSAPPAEMFNFNSNKTTTITSTATTVSIAVVSAPQSLPSFKLPTSMAVTVIAAPTSLPTPVAVTSIPFSAPTTSMSSIPGIFSFSKSPPENSQPATAAFGAAPLSTQPSKIPVATFSFGSSNAVAAPVNAVPISAAAPAPNSSMFSFGSTPSKDPTPTLLPATSAPPIKTPFAFGSNSIATSTATNAPVPSLFSFETGTNTNTSAPVSKSTTFTGFSTGSAVAAPPTSAFGGMGSGPGNAAATTAPVFGGSAATPSFSFDNKKTTPVFGSSGGGSAAQPATTPSSTFSFGGSGTLGLGSTTTTSASPFGNNATSPIFGSATTQPAPPAYGAPKTATSPFGGSTTSNAPPFGSQQRPSGIAAPFSFGGSSASQSSALTNQNAEPQKSSTFAFGTGGGSVTTTTSPFAFGGGATNQVGNSQPAPIFGSSTGNATPAPSFGGPRSTAATPFGDNNTNSTFSFGQAAAAPQPAASSNSFNFSGSNGAGPGPAASTGGSFKFGEPSAQTTQTNAPSMFNFGGAPQPTASSSFAFGQNGGGGGVGVSNQVAGNGGGMFNFGAQGDPNAGAAGPTFNIGSGGGGPPRRPIRQATRRMK